MPIDRRTGHRARRANLSASPPGQPQVLVHFQGFSQSSGRLIA